MAKDTNQHPVIDALKKLKDEESEILLKLKPLQEAIGALEKIVEKNVKKSKSSPSTKDNGVEADERLQEVEND